MNEEVRRQLRHCFPAGQRKGLASFRTRPELPHSLDCGALTVHDPGGTHLYVLEGDPAEAEALCRELGLQGTLGEHVWSNPEPQAETLPGPKTTRVAAVQYPLRQLSSWDDFQRQLAHYGMVAHDYGADFLVFPELFTLQLLSLDPGLPPREAVSRLSEHTERVRELFQRLAIRYNLNLIGGSHLHRNSAGQVQNLCLVALRDGTLHQQSKLHPTPNERASWEVEGGEHLDAIWTEAGPIGVLICYDSEFPELTRRLVQQGVGLIFVPFCTDDRHGYLRVRYCSHARAVESQCYLVLAGSVGNLQGVANLDVLYAQSCVLTPCDFPFARDGVAAEASPNTEAVVVADLDLGALYRARRQGTVRNLLDRRHDLYGVAWHRTAP